ncbi:hypothetical protein SKAU_G00315800 [Synaphobranchus kaupii]|uniref:Uncharacterized protein n=1 Tax=Synaphobranchus kaupii TaxID=118154 RepID=A0A9Q1ESK9_SYNKA|nr:hypothetical protein SKAU_G00315800 [Synaphobranchus kaupii]
MVAQILRLEGYSSVTWQSCNTKWRNLRHSNVICCRDSILLCCRVSIFVESLIDKHKIVQYTGTPYDTRDLLE